MNRYSATASIILVFIAFSCADFFETTSSPVEPEVIAEYGASTDVCRANMRTIASQQVIYFAVNERYASTLRELELEGLACPECGTEYILEADFDEFSIFCPLPSVTTHGSIINGVTSWNEGYQNECRDNIRTMACSNIMFFAEHGRYANSMEELGFGNITCPACEDLYVYYANENDDFFYLSCPLPLPFECHGSFHSNTGYSWHEESQGGETECRSNMIIIASQEVIYFASNETYTESLEDLGLGGMICPGCGESYFLQVTGGGEELYIECGMQALETHGNIDNGVPSW